MAEESSQNSTEEEKVEKKPDRYTFEDIDGTAYTGTVIGDLAAFAASRSERDRIFSTRFNRYQLEYKSGSIDYLTFAKKIGKLVRSWVGGRPQDWLSELMTDFTSKHDLGRLINKKSLEMHHKCREFSNVVAISAEPREIVEGMDAVLPFDDIIATELEKDDKGNFTGKYESNLFGWRDRIGRLKEYTSRANINPLVDTIAIGDSPHDQFMFDKVAYPVARNPSSELEETADKKGWFIYRDTDKIERFLTYVNNPREHWDYWRRLTPEDKQLLQWKRTYGSWDNMRRVVRSEPGLLGRIFSGKDGNVGRINKRIEELEKKEKDGGVDLSGYLSGSLEGY